MVNIGVIFVVDAETFEVLFGHNLEFINQDIHFYISN